MDITDIYLSRIVSAEKLFKDISKALDNADIKGISSLSEFLGSITQQTNFRVFISNEQMEQTPADEALECIKSAVDGNENISAEFLTDEFVNIVDENDRLTSECIPRSVVHRNGKLHPTVHIWFIRRRDMGVHVLLQKRSHEKDICPDCYDVSTAGHVTQGDEFKKTALKEIHEELGIDVPSNKLIFLGMRHSHYEFGEIHDNELVAVYIYKGDHIHHKELTLQESEVSEVCWAEIDELISLMKHEHIDSCFAMEELDMIKKACF
ncbi:MAG: NUDIX domain-containing protein [Ruminococcus sp.]|nr:NUDIX domain-containing protein [Ruminococcus sp.]